MPPALCRGPFPTRNPMLQPTIQNSNTYEVIVKQGVSKFLLPDDAILRKKRITGVAIRNQNSGGTRLSTTGRTLVSNNALSACFISLFQDSKAILNDCPAEYFVPDDRQGAYVAVNIPQFSPSTSYVRFADNTRISDDQVVELTFYYED